MGKFGLRSDIAIRKDTPGILLSIIEIERERERRVLVTASGELNHAQD